MNLVYFISSNEILTDDNWEKVITDNNNFQAISYWSDHVPDLYLLEYNEPYKSAINIFNSRAIINWVKENLTDKAPST